jgi:hypothetical protein
VAALLRDISGVRRIHDELFVGGSWFEQLSDWASKML